MAAFAVPDSVRDFIQRYINSVEAIEVLLWLRRHGAEADAETLARELRSSVPSVTQRIAELTSYGLVQGALVPGRFKYAVAGSSLDHTVAQLEECYRTAPFRTMELVYAKPAEKIQTFADAFRLRRDKDDDKGTD